MTVRNTAATALIRTLTRIRVGTHIKLHNIQVFQSIQIVLNLAKNGKEITADWIRCLRRRININVLYENLNYLQKCHGGSGHCFCPAVFGASPLSDAVESDK